MARVAIEVRGLDVIQRRFSQAPQIIDTLLKRAGRETMQVGMTRLSFYPALRPGQTYRRTGRLGRGWTQNKPTFVGGGGRTLIRLTNPVSYARYVHGPPRQVWFHQGRWASIQQAQQAMNAAAPAILGRAADAAARSLSG